jgi:SM-20-related protein
MSACEALFQSLETRGWAMSATLVSKDLATRLHEESLQLWRAGQFRPARIGRGDREMHEAAVRGDAICWIEADTAGPACREFLHWIAGFRRALNQAFFLGLNSEEFHFARYPAGAGYEKHIDRHKGTTARKVSVTLYLNADWPAGAGGELCLYARGEAQTPAYTVPPALGNTAVFLSDIIPHEVKPATQTRWSLTGWLRTDTQGIA